MTKFPVPQAGPTSPFARLYGQSYILLVFAQLFWAANTVSGKLAVGEIDPFVLSALRWSLALLMLAPFALPHLRRDRAAILKSWYWLALYGGLGFSTFNVLMYLAPHFTSAVNLSMEQAVIPVMVMAGNFVIFRVRARPLQIVGLLLTVYGVVHVATHGDPGRILGLNVNIGDGMALAACVLYAAYSLILRFRPAIHWLSFLFSATAAAALFSLMFQLTLGGGPQALVSGLAQATPQGWLIVLYVAIFPSILAQLFYARGVELIGPNRASVFINLLPVFGALLAVLAGETLEDFHLVAALFIIAGIVLAEYSARRGLAGPKTPAREDAAQK